MIGHIRNQDGGFHFACDFSCKCALLDHVGSYSLIETGLSL